MFIYIDGLNYLLSKCSCCLIFHWHDHPGAWSTRPCVNLSFSQLVTLLVNLFPYFGPLVLSQGNSSTTFFQSYIIWKLRSVNEDFLQSIKEPFKCLFYKNIYTIFISNFEDIDSIYIIKIQNNKGDEIGNELTKAGLD